MDGPAPPEEDFTTLPISDRIAHKNWKARVSGYEALIKTFQNTASDTDPAFKPYISNTDLIKKFATDANAVAQEKGVESLVALVKFAGETAAKTREAIVPALVDKCLGSTRAGTRNQAIELVLQYVEVENGGTGVNDLLPGLGAKQPKVVAGCVTALKEVIRNFGIQVTPPPPVLKALPKIFAHSDKTVRAEGTALALSLYQYLGPGIESWLSDLKPVQVKELKEAFEGLEKDGKGKGSVKPERLTRELAREAELQADAGEEAAEDDAPAEPEDFDPRAFAEPEDIVPKLPANLHTNLKSSKWKERKEALDDLLTLVNATPRIKDAPELSELAKALATCISKDANINCVMVAANCLEGLAKAMMDSFAKYRESTVPLMLVRLKERKATVTDAIGAALDAIFSTVTLNDILPDLEPALKDKNPQVKEGTLKFLGRALSAATSAIPPNQIKPLSESLAVLLEDGFEGARNEAANCFGTLMKMVGERPLNAIMDSMADVRKAKVKEAFEKATVKCKAGGAAPARKAPPAAAAPKAPATKKPAAKPPAAAAPPPEPEKEPEAPPPPKKPVAKPSAKKVPAVVAAASAPAAAKKPVGTAPPAAKGGKPAPAPAASALDSFKYKHTPEDAEAVAADMIPSNLLTDFADSNWKTRLAALEEMTTWLEGEVDTIDAEVLVRALAKKGWSEKNFQVSTKLYAILSILAQRCPSFGRSCVALSVGHLTEKLGDMKLKKPAGDTLLDFVEKTSLQFVLSQAYEPLSKQKAPKVLADAITWIGTALTEFGIAGLSLRSVIDFLKVGLANSNAAVRTSATKTLVTIKLFAGSGIKDLLEDINPQLLSTISSEFDKAEGTPAPTPSRTSADVVNLAPAGGSGKGGAAAADALDDLFPRVELDGLMKGTTILTDAKSDAWKTKKEALETLQAILDQGNNKRLKPNMGEIGQILKARVVDTNKAVQTLALDIVARIATGMGKGFEKHSRLFATPVATVLSDQKAPIRNSALQTLTAIATACEGLESLVAGFATALETQNPLQKATLLGWLADWLKENEASSSLDLHAWAASVVGSLDDRNADVRKGAQAILPFLIKHAGYDFVLQQTNALKPASRSTAVPLIQAARPAGSEAPAPPPAAPAPEKKAPAPRPSSVASIRPPSRASDGPGAAAPAAMKPPSKLGVRRKLPQGTSRPESRAESVAESGLRLPGASGLRKPGAPAVQSPVQSSTGPFHSTNPDSKRLRLGKDVQKWINEGGAGRKDLAELLQTQMEPHASKELISRLFSNDHNAVNDHVTGLGMMADFYSSAQGDEIAEKICIANIDFPLKYVSLKVHESQSNLVAKCLDVTEAVLGFARAVNYQLSESEAICFVPTMAYKLGDAREPVRNRVSLIIRSLPKVYAYSRIFQFLLEHGCKAKVAKTRQGSLDEISAILKKSGMSACEPSKAMPAIAALISDKDPAVRKSALTALSEVYTLVGEKIWSLVGPLSPKDKTQLEERLRRVPGPSTVDKPEPAPAPSAVPAPVSRLAGSGLQRPSSPAMSRLARPASPARSLRPVSPAVPAVSAPESPVRARAGSLASNGPASPTGIARPKSLLPSRLARPRTNMPQPAFNSAATAPPPPREETPPPPEPEPLRMRTATSNGYHSSDRELPAPRSESSDDVTITISSILSSDPTRSVDALKKIQKILSVSPEAGPSSPQYRDLAEHTEGLIETITLQMAHAFENPENLLPDDNFRLAKHLIQTLNNFCDHSFLAESLTVGILTSLLEELTLRLLETDDSSVKKIKDLSRFINMIILRLFATGRRMSIFRALFALLLQIVKPFPSRGTLPDSKEAKVAELVLKCVWKLARNIPQDLADSVLDPVELFPAVEHFLQSVPPNEWRARATNKVPCGDMPLRTIKVIIQHVVGHYGDDVYELLSASFDDPSATIVYPYVYRILNSSNKGAAAGAGALRGNINPPVGRSSRAISPASSRPRSPVDSVSARSHREATSHRTSPSGSSANGNHPPYTPAEEPDPDAQLLTIIGHISSETTGALHKEGITELHHFLKAYPHKRPRVEKMLESTGPVFRKYINRALASRAAEDQEREVAVTQSLESTPSRDRGMPSPTLRSPTRATSGAADTGERLSRLHDIFQYRSSTISSGSSAPRTSNDFGSS
ncbi:microtubule associated protein [Coprinopsis cinerea okayama7|uniref:Microtubule associated protein n=1 Tax=Coprinopsis cinerea (strain Okayama-7 / 130 / ATCC MYA-4618 / FGSC 9003) TaxID=240176 RepID=D6RKG5_COPC7|nr:microtubule associated protein [Coprinopsis cinerea okayama7\|eukprot:XP_002911875.1 microtubule associated protein [Coprinopsis cinerea okayama7\